MLSRRLYPLERGVQSLPCLILYAVTFALQLVCGFARGIVFYLPIVAVLAITGHHAGGSTPNEIGDVIAYAPLVWSLSALVYPLGAGWIWRATSGGRPPSERERVVVERVISYRQARDPGVRGPASWFVLDDPDHNAAVSGNTLSVNSGAIGDYGFTAMIAHELGHLNSSDGRLIVALVRLETPARLLAKWRDGRDASPGGCLTALFGGVAEVASGAIVWRIMLPFWEAWFRAREFKADAYAARLGLADELADGLERDALEYDRPTPLRFLSGATHPFTELRIDRLRDYAERNTEVTA